MKIKRIVVAAFVLLLKAILTAYVPDLPVSEELVNALVLYLLTAAGVEVVELLPGVRKVVAKLTDKKLWG